VSSQEPASQSDVTVTLTLVRDGRPVEGAAVYLVAHYRTANERQPPGEAAARTDANGRAALTFNIGNATRGYAVNVDLTALIEGRPTTFTTSFTPR